MNTDLMMAIAAAVVSLLVGFGFSLIERLANHLPLRVQKFLQKVGIFEEEKEATTYQIKVKTSIAALEVAAKQVDRVVLEVSNLVHERETTIASLEDKLSELTRRENELTSKIETLERVPIEAVRHFEEILQRGEKRSAFRDYILFGLGVIVSTTIAFMLKLIGY